MANKKKSHDVSGLPIFGQALSTFIGRTQNGPISFAAGVYNDKIIEARPKYIQANCEKVNRHGSCMIKMGRDRPRSRASGHGGAGHTQAGTLDLVAGLGGSSPSNDVFVDPNFVADAARIYISEKTDIDENFNLASGFMGNMKNRSAIGIKADGVRVIGQEGIKLVTRTEPRNSKDGFSSFSGIELIACNDETDIQPMVKGDNLVKALTELEEIIRSVATILSNHISDYNQFVTQVSSHQHVYIDTTIAGGTPNITQVSPTLTTAAAQQCVSAVSNMQDVFNTEVNSKILWTSRYLQPYSVKPPEQQTINDDSIRVKNPGYILSKYNKVN